MTSFFDIRLVITKAHDDKGEHKSGVIRATHLKHFLSAEQTGTGAEQAIAHGLGVVPALVMVYLTGGPATYAAPAITEGAHTSTNVLVTVTSGWKYKVFALA